MNDNYSLSHSRWKGKCSLIQGKTVQLSAGKPMWVDWL